MNARQWIFHYILPLVLLSVTIDSSNLRSDRSKRLMETLSNKTTQTNGSSRVGKFLPIFQVINFPNDLCTSSGTKNGTCYTTDECSSKGGTASGSCADGFGVCCIFSLTCGGETNDNNTYLILSTTTTQPDPNPCTYKLCKASSNICRIKLEFNRFTIASPQAGTTATGAPAVPGTAGGAIGDCISDQFSVATPGGVSSPIICGENGGQHILVDASSSCNLVTFNIGDSTATREWDITVTQHTCGSELGGPSSCLQFFTGISGTISSFNFPVTSTTVSSAATHLSKQSYQICIRTEKGYCGICYTTAITEATADQGVDRNISFGLSISTDIASKSATGTQCTTDYVQIPMAEAAPLNIGTPGTGQGYTRFCGRVFHLETGKDASIAGEIGTSICSQSRPFVISVVTDEDEATAAVAMAADPAPNTNEMDNVPGGIVGFSLNYLQISC